MIFSSDARLASEHLILSAMPRLESAKDLEDAFMSSLTRDDAEVFADFCSRKDYSFRFFRLLNFYPFHFAFMEKCRIGSEIKNIVFLAEDIAQLHSLMSPASETLRNITSGLVCEFSNQNDSDKPICFTPESLLALSHIPSFTAMLRADERKNVYCDLHKLIECACRSFSKMEFYSDIKFDRMENRDGALIIELPITPFIYVLSSVFAVMYAISSDRSIKIETRKFSYAGEITLTANTTLSEKLPGTCTSICDIANAFPSIAAIAQSATIVSLFSGLMLDLNVDRGLETVTVTLGAGFDFQSEPDFKFSDPYSLVDRIVTDAIGIFDTIK